MKGVPRREFINVMTIYTERMAMIQAAKRGHIDPNLEVPDTPRTTDGEKQRR